MVLGLVKKYNKSIQLGQTSAVFFCAKRPKGMPKGSGIELVVENHHLSPGQFVATALAVISDD